MSLYANIITTVTHCVACSCALSDYAVLSVYPYGRPFYCVIIVAPVVEAHVHTYTCVPLRAG